MRFGSALVLAGGRSARMGFDKQKLRLASGKPLPHLVIEKLSPHFKDILVVTQIPDFYRDLEVRTLSDVYPGKGPLAGIHAGLRACKSDLAFVVGCDMPRIDLEVNRMMEACDRPGAQIISLQTPFRFQALYAYYHRDLVGSAEDLLQRAGASVYDLAKDARHVVCDQPALLDRVQRSQVLLNINKPEEWVAYQEGLDVSQEGL